MELDLYDIIHAKAATYFTSDDPSHDFQHVLRVLKNARAIQSQEGGDLDVIIPAVYFHDCINYAKTDPRASCAAAESAETAEKELLSIPSYPHEKFPAVKTAIVEHSYSAGLQASTLESKIMQDSDRLEATGAIAIMRTFASTGQFKRPFYDPADPFCSHRPAAGLNYALDVFYVRLLRVGENMNTDTAKKMAETRTEFLENFLDQLSDEIGMPRLPEQRLKRQPV